MIEVVKGWKHLLKGEYASKRDFEFVLIGRRAYKNKQNLRISGGGLRAGRSRLAHAENLHATPLFCLTDDPGKH